jgi:hypothetical protein
MITDVFSLAHVGAEELRWAQRPRDRFPCVSARAIGPNDLARLGEVLGAGPAEALLAGFRFLAGESQEPPWVVAMPRDLVDRLNDLRDGEMARPVAQWAKVLDDVGGAHSSESLRSYLRRLLDFVTRYGGPYVLYISADEPQQKGVTHD